MANVAFYISISAIASSIIFIILMIAHLAIISRSHSNWIGFFDLDTRMILINAVALLFSAIGFILIATSIWFVFLKNVDFKYIVFVVFLGTFSVIFSAVWWTLEFELLGPKEEKRVEEYL